MIKTAVRVTRRTWRKDTKTELWQQTCERVFHASRQHWGIENRNHYARNILRANRAENLSRQLHINDLSPEQAMSYAVTREN